MGAKPRFFGRGLLQNKVLKWLRNANFSTAIYDDKNVLLTRYIIHIFTEYAIGNI